MSDLSSPTADRKIFVRHTVLFWGEGARQGCPNLRYFAFPASTSFSWLPQSHYALFRFPLGEEKGGEGFRDVPTSRTLHSRLPLLFLGFLSTISLRGADSFPVVAFSSEGERRRPEIRLCFASSRRLQSHYPCFDCEIFSKHLKSKVPF